MGSILKDQIRIYVENLLYYEYILIEHNRIELANKTYKDLQAADEIIHQNKEIK